MKLLAIDPGPEESAFVWLEGGAILEKGKISNENMLTVLESARVVVIEKIASYGMSVGEEVFETVFWSGRFAQVAFPAAVVRIPRLAVKMNLCKKATAKDSNIRQALIDRYGGQSAIKKGGALHGFAKDTWAALAVGLTYLDTKGES